jgi:TolB protein
MTTKTIRILFTLIAVMLGYRLLAGPETALAKVYIDLDAPSIERLPVAVQEFIYLGDNPTLLADTESLENIARILRETIENDLDFSGLFRVIDEEAFLEDVSEEGLSVMGTDFEQWRITGAEAVIKGGFDIVNGKLEVEARLFDVIRESTVIGKKYIGNPKKPDRLAHYFTDQLYEKLTGRKGIFSTRLLFVSTRTGNKEIYVSDYDGTNARRITGNGSINLSPQWSPDGTKLLYTSYKEGCACLYMLDMRTGRDRAISKNPGINISGRFSPDGKSVALTLSSKKSPDLYLLNIKDGTKQRLTNNYGIDVSPTFSPDGKRVAYVSDISGNPHIFVLDLTTGKRRRLTYKGVYNTSPTWSPDGKWIAFSRAAKGKFDIWLLRANGGGGARVTWTGNNKSPSWSPDSSKIVFSSTRNGSTSLYVIGRDGNGLRKLKSKIGNELTPAWSPYLN